MYESKYMNEWVSYSAWQLFPSLIPSFQFRIKFCNIWNTIVWSQMLDWFIYVFASGNFKCLWVTHVLWPQFTQSLSRCGFLRNGSSPYQWKCYKQISIFCTLFVREDLYYAFVGLGTWEAWWAFAGWHVCNFIKML